MKLSEVTPDFIRELLDRHRDAKLAQNTTLTTESGVMLVCPLGLIALDAFMQEYDQVPDYGSLDWAFKWAAEAGVETNNWQRYCFLNGFDGSKHLQTCRDQPACDSYTAGATIQEQLAPIDGHSIEIVKGSIPVYDASQPLYKEE